MWSDPEATQQNLLEAVASVPADRAFNWQLPQRCPMGHCSRRLEEAVVPGVWHFRASQRGL